jgi:hypothetical protein
MDVLGAIEGGRLPSSRQIEIELGPRGQMGSYCPLKVATIISQAPVVVVAVA